jgi:hypothetical protein
VPRSSIRARICGWRRFNGAHRYVTRGLYVSRQPRPVRHLPSLPLRERSNRRRRHLRRTPAGAEDLPTYGTNSRPFVLWTVDTSSTSTLAMPTARRPSSSSGERPRSRRPRPKAVNASFARRRGLRRWHKAGNRPSDGLGEAPGRTPAWPSPARTDPCCTPDLVTDAFARTAKGCRTAADRLHDRPRSQDRVPLKVVSERLGHSAIAVTADTCRSMHPEIAAVAGAVAGSFRAPRSEARSSRRDAAFPFRSQSSQLRGQRFPKIPNSSVSADQEEGRPPGIEP